MNNKKKLTVLGSTGSIGLNTLAVAACHPDEFEIFALTARSNVSTLAEQCLRFSPRFAVMAQEKAADELRQILKKQGAKTVVLSGPQAICEVASHAEVDMVMAAIVGIAGLSSCLAAARAGKRLLLANKEALVVGGELFMQAVKEGGATLLPIDSEHSAIFQALPTNCQEWHDGRVDKIILTASGGAFRTRELNTFHSITVQQAISHPNWSMGTKITVDSATMMNKALEVIEAHYLFNVPPEKIEVLIHPQSIIHSMVQYVDSSIVAQLGSPDMRCPISFGLFWPARGESGAAKLDFSTLSALTFENAFTEENKKRFPCLSLAWKALDMGAESAATAVLNAANEIAVQAFLDEQIRFDQIYQINAQMLQEFHSEKLSSEADLLALDKEVKNHTIQRIKRC